MTIPECIFCSIAAGKSGTGFIFENEEVVAFRDINPQAPFHVLIIPRKHTASLAETADERMLGVLLAAAARIAAEAGLSDYRLVINNGARAGQSVFHLHLHLLGGRTMNWPPG